MFKKQDIWDYLAVEIAVKLNNLLNSQDSDSYVYEYIGEAKAVSQWCKKYAQEDNMKPSAISNMIRQEFESSIGHEYSSEDFDSLSEFICSRVNHFKTMALI